MVGEAFFFYAFSALALLGALGTVLLRSAVHCSLALMTFRRNLSTSSNTATSRSSRQRGQERGK